MEDDKPVIDYEVTDLDALYLFRETGLVKILLTTRQGNELAVSLPLPVVAKLEAKLAEMNALLTVHRGLQ